MLMLRRNPNISVSLSHSPGPRFVHLLVVYSKRGLPVEIFSSAQDDDASISGTSLSKKRVSEDKGSNDSRLQVYGT